MTAPIKKVVVHASRRVPPARCPGCGHVNDSATGLHDADSSPLGHNTPKPGDVMVCFYCGHLSQWGEAGGFVELSAEKAREVAGDPVILAAQRIRAALTGPGPKPGRRRGKKKNYRQMVKRRPGETV